MLVAALHEYEILGISRFLCTPGSHLGESRLQSGYTWEVEVGVHYDGWRPLLAFSKHGPGMLNVPWCVGLSCTRKSCPTPQASSSPLSNTPVPGLLGSP